ncbi:MAG TPA: hypothetical protein PLB32_06540 [Acidobacteriota bacterium]|nr:hypothetical protein [Acidobacteriota bacterium]
MPKLEAVVEGIYELDEFPWPQAKCLAPDYMWVHPAMSDEEIGFVIGQFITCEVLHKRLDARSMLQTILKADELILRGGLRVIDEKNGLVINPGCCCGLEGWWEWLRFVTNGDFGPWLGHDPRPSVEQTPWGYRVWSGEEEENASNFIDFQGDELNLQVGQIQCDLIGFLEAVRVWASRIDPELTDALVQKIDEQFSITNPYRNFPYDH